MLIERDYNLHMSLGSVHRYMRILNIRSLRTKKYYPKKKEVQNRPYVFPNILKQDFCASQISRKWLTDITYLPCKDGTLYLSCIKDLCDKSIIAYHLSSKNDQVLVMKTLQKAKPFMQQGTILHSDQGSQYMSPLYHRYLAEHGMLGSMSRKGTPYDNAPMESFFSLLKNEELKLYRNRTIAATKGLVDRFIRYYNEKRPQWNMKKLTPIEYRKQLAF